MSTGSELSAGTPTPPVFPAKLRKPDISSYLRRDRLYKQLDDASTPLVVIHAGAGYGKTTLIASYLRDRPRQSIWYNFGIADRLQGTFVAHIRHALTEAFPEAAHPVPDPLQATEDPEMSGAALAALLARGGVPLAFVLEDYHRVEGDSEIQRVVLGLIEHVPPNVQVFLLSRTRPPLPLARLTIDGRIKVLTRDDLAFTAEETAALFVRTYERYLSPEEMALVEQRLEGWAAGLRLTHEALKMTREQDRARFWARFSDSPALFDYLAEEVLAALPESILDFLSRTSIFFVLQPEIVEEFLPGCRASSTLSRLARENLFTTALSGAGTHYRYHSLLRQYLHRQLAESVGEEGVRHLHAQVAALYARRGELDYAIGHNLVAGEYQQVTRLLELLVDRHGGDVVLRLLEGWLERGFPEMEGVSGIALRRLVPMSVYEYVLPDLRQAAEETGQDVDPINQAHAQLRLGAYLYYRGRLEECMLWLERSRNTFKAGGHLIPACYAGMLEGLAYLYSGDLQKAATLISQALAWAGSDSTYPRTNALWATAELALANGNCREAEAASRAALDSDTPFPIAGAFYNSTLAIALLHQGRTEEALAACTEALSHAERLGIPTDLGIAHIRQAMVLRAAGRLEEARAAVEKAVGVLAGYDFLLARALLARADLAAAAGDPQASRLWGETQEFWQSRGYSMVRGYDSLVAPLLLSAAAGRQPLTEKSDGREGAIAAAESPPAAVPEEATSAAHPLAIYALGAFRLRIEGRESDPGSWDRASARRLFFHLLIQRGRRVHREEILEILWPEDDPAVSINRLWVSVHALRKELTPLSGIVDRQGQTYCLRLPPGTDLDIDRYIRLAEDGLSRGDPSLLREAASLYRGDLLTEYPFDEFLEPERARLREMQTRVVLSLANLSRRAGDLEDALAWYRQAQELEPLLEEPVLRTMEVLLARGEAALATDTYLRHRDQLGRELGVEPSAELDQLYQKAQRGSREQ